MTDWFRSWHGAPTDPKWRTIARRAGVRPGDVAAIVWALLDRASQAKDRGSIEGYDSEVIADALGYEPEEIEAVVAAMVDKQVLIGMRFAGWEKHQPSRDDGSAERAREWRERKKDVANADERTRTQPNATERPREDTDTETDSSDANASDAGVSDDDFPPDAFEVWYAAYPHKIGRSAAEKAFHRVRKTKPVTFSELVDGLERYIRTKPPDRAWCNPATWLNQDRWADQPDNVQPLFQSGTRPNAQASPTVQSVAADLAEWARREDETDRERGQVLQIGSG